MFSKCGSREYKPSPETLSALLQGCPLVHSAIYLLGTYSACSVWLAPPCVQALCNVLGLGEEVSLGSAVWNSLSQRRN